MPRYAVIYNDNDEGSQCTFVHAPDLETAKVAAKTIVFGNPSQISIYGHEPSFIDVTWDEDSPMYFSENGINPSVSDAYLVELTYNLPVEQWQEELDAICRERKQAFMAELQVKQQRIGTQIDSATDDKLYDAGFIRWLREKRPRLVEDFLGEHELEKDPSVSP